MNKKRVIIIVAICLVVALVAGGIVGCILFVRKPISGEKFKSKMEATTFGSDNEKFEVVDGTSELSETSLVKESLVAKRGTAYKVFYTKMKSKQDALNAFAENRKEMEFFEKEGEDSTTGKNKYEALHQRGLNFHTYTLNTDYYYYMVSQVGDTFIYVVLPNDYKDEIDDVFKDLGYL